MGAPEIHQLSPEGISCHAWNKDRSKVALCPNNNDIHIYKRVGNKFEREAVLVKHDQLVTGLDWAPNTNRIVSCAQDRNAYVWNHVNNEWKPTLVILRINRAATDVTWNQDETKFAVASASQCIPVCYFESNNDWWVAKIIRKGLSSTILSVAWNKSGDMLAAGCVDKKCRLFSAHIKDVDQTPAAGLAEGHEFGSLLAEMDCNGWVHRCCWSPSGNICAFASHDSTLNLATIEPNRQISMQYVKMRDLPLKYFVFLREDAIVGVGHEYSPILFAVKDGKWVFVKKLDSQTDTGPKKEGFASTLKMFQSTTSMGQSNSASNKLTTVHTNTVTFVQSASPDGGNVDKFSTTGLDGRLLLWEIGSIEDALKDLKI